jgi:hypothetical protein
MAEQKNKQSQWISEQLKRALMKMVKECLNDIKHISQCNPHNPTTVFTMWLPPQKYIRNPSIVQQYADAKNKVIM